MLTSIRFSKRTVEASPATTASVATLLDGTYQWTITKDDALAHGTPNDKTPENLATFPWVFTMTMKDGTTHLKHRDGDGAQDDGVGAYTVNGDQLTFTRRTVPPRRRSRTRSMTTAPCTSIPYSPWTPATSS